MGDHARHRNRVPESPHGPQASPRLERNWPFPPQKGGFGQGCSSYPCVCASSASICPPRQMREHRKGVIMAIFSLGFLWLCSPEVGEMHFVSVATAVVFFQLLISVKDKVLQPLAGPAESNSKSQDWYPKGPAWSMISHHYSGGNIYPNGGRALAGFC